VAREEGELVGEQFLHWFLQEQREEVSSMSDLLAIVERANASNILLAEEYLARAQVGDAGETTAAPPAPGAPPAGGRRAMGGQDPPPGGLEAPDRGDPGRAAEPLGRRGRDLRRHRS